MEQLIDFRPIEAKDIWLIYDWSNDYISRKNSFSTEGIEKSNHEKWFLNKLNDNNAVYLIGKLNGNDIAIVRFDVEANSTLIGVNISPENRGKSLSSTFIHKAINYAEEKLTFPIIAYIKNENIASIKAFSKAGFIFDKSVKIKGSEAQLYNYKK